MRVGIGRGLVGLCIGLLSGWLSGAGGLLKGCVDCCFGMKAVRVVVLVVGSREGGVGGGRGGGGLRIVLGCVVLMFRSWLSAGVRPAVLFVVVLCVSVRGWCVVGRIGLFRLVV